MAHQSGRSNFTARNGYGNGRSGIYGCRRLISKNRVSAAKAAEEPEFTYVGNGIVSVQLLTDEGEPYTCEITFTQKDNEIKYVRKDSR